ncbi:MAG TPA: DUF4080 domain-containing protein [Clostridiaceae bacterium]|nr:DUF4080 domain-containing protein [Clostridiaceae bacterium]
MKTVIVSLNAKYIHSSLAPWYLKACCGEKHGEVRVLEFTINDNMDHVLMDIYEQKADILAFSCYIWNISRVLKLIANIRKISPGLKIILGGPEISFESGELMECNPCIDYIIAGEGEISFPKLLECLHCSSDNFSEIEGLYYRDSAGKVISPEKPVAYVEDINEIPSPYTEEMLLSIGKSKIAYFESSRGCPFSCSYCLSSVSKGVRYFNMERVKKDITRLIDAGVKQIKFVDRTFNCNKKRALEIFSFVIENGGNTNFHFEAAADLFDDEMLELLRTAPGGQIQFEIGVQTTNNDALEAVDRKTNLDRVFYNTSRLRENGNTHIHLDLIAGLPFEDMDSFIRSFNDVYNLEPHQLQLGFLKLLKGSRIRRDAHLHGYIFRDYPPYEILSNRYMSFDDFAELKGIEEIVERYYNTGRFAGTLKYIVGKLYHSLPYIFYRDFYRYNSGKGYMRRPVALNKLYDIIFDFVREKFSQADIDAVKELLRFDFLSCDKSGSLPASITRMQPDGFKENCFDFLRNENNIQTYLPSFAGETPKNIYKYVRFELFGLDVSNYLKDGSIEKRETVLLFDYSKADKVTGRYKSHNVTESFI